VKHQPKIVLYSNCDALANSPHFAYRTALDTGNWRVRGSKQKGVSKSYSLERLCDDAWFEGSDIRDDIRQFRHAYQLACRNRISQPRLFNAGNYLCRVWPKSGVRRLKVFYRGRANVMPASC